MLSEVTGIKIPKISFVLPAYNAVAWIGEALQSLLMQTVHDIEIIVVDDCSTDGTREFLQEWTPQFPNLKVIYNEKNLGAGESRNIGTKEAKAPIIGICDADDIYADERARLILEHFERNPESELVNFPYLAIGYYNEQIEEFPGMPFDHDLYLKEGKCTFYCNPSAAVKKEALEAVGGFGKENFDENVKMTDDAIFLEKWVKSGRKVDFVPNFCVTFHRNLPNSMMTKVRGWAKEWVEAK